MNIEFCCAEGSLKENALVENILQKYDTVLKYNVALVYENNSF